VIRKRPLRGTPGNRQSLTYPSGGFAASRVPLGVCVRCVPSRPIGQPSSGPGSQGRGGKRVFAKKAVRPGGATGAGPSFGFEPRPQPEMRSEAEPRRIVPIPRDPRSPLRGRLRAISGCGRGGEDVRGAESRIRPHCIRPASLGPCFDAQSFDEPGTTSSECALEHHPERWLPAFGKR
jgi:hypothetical protein